MVRLALSMALAIALVGCSRQLPAQGRTSAALLITTEIGTPHQVRLADLIGLDPTGVQRRLTELPTAWPTPVGLEMAFPGGTVTLANLGEWLTDPSGHEISERGEDHVEGPPAAFEQCGATYVGASPAAVSARFVTLEFHNGRLARAWREPVPGKGRPPRPVLNEGWSFTSRWGREVLDPGTVFSIDCQRSAPNVETISRLRRTTGDAAGLLQGLSLLSQSGKLPTLNAQREAAMRGGHSTYDILKPGTMLPRGVRSFAAAHRFVTIRTGSDPRYVLLEIDLGARPSRNLTYFHHVGLVGVRDNQVQWRSQVGRQSIPGLAREPELPQKRDPTIVG